MTTREPRHGTALGYRDGCRNPRCCVPAQRRYRVSCELDQLAGKPRQMNPTGTIRRVQALYALGWSWTDQAEHCGMDLRVIHRIGTTPRAYVLRDTAELLDRMFRDLSMVVPTGHGANRIRKSAAKKGWVPPLCWNNIDDPDEVPQGVRGPEGKASLDSGEIAELVYLGGTYASITERLGCSKDGVFRRLRADGRHDLLGILTERGSVLSSAYSEKGVKGRRRAA